VSAASEALADVRGWLCDNLSAGDAGKVCGMLSVVSRHITELEDENAKLRELLHDAAIELYVNGNITDGATELLFDQMRELGIDLME
jgi:hypothetical protein